MGYIEFFTSKRKMTDFLEHLKCSGKNIAGDPTTLVKDALINVTPDSIWAIVIDSAKTIIACASMKTKVNTESLSETPENNFIPIIINDLLDRIKQFDTNDEISIVYENNIIKTGAIFETEDKKKKKHEFYYNTVRKQQISDDFLTKMELDLKRKADSREKINSYIDYVIEHNFSVFQLNYVDGKDDPKSANVLTGNDLNTMIEINSNQLKNIVKDADIVSNHLFSFKIEPDNVSVRIENEAKNDEGGAYRDLITKKFKTEKSFDIVYDNVITSAILGARGHVILWFDKNAPLLLIKESVIDYEASLVYVVLPYKPKS